MVLKSVCVTCCVLLLVQFESISAEPYICPEIGRYPIPESIDCRSYYSCQLNSDGYLEATIVRCPGATIFDSTRCVAISSYTCPGPTTSTTEVQITEITSTESPNGFVCPGEGRYPNPESSDCKTYYSCVKNSDGYVVSTLYTCPGNTIFGLPQYKCVATSTNTCSSVVTTSTEESSTEPVTTSEPVTTTIVTSTELKTTPEPTTTTAEPSTEPPSTSEPTITSPAAPNVFTCVASGRFANPEQPDCQTYKYCLQTAATTFQEYTFRCPAGSNFNAAEARCSAGFICPKILTTTTSEAPTTTSASAAPAFVCEVEGRFPDPESCNQYIFCTRASDGSLVQHAFRCPPNSWFKPNESRCSASYVCN